MGYISNIENANILLLCYSIEIKYLVKVKTSVRAFVNIYSAECLVQLEFNSNLLRILFSLF